MKTSTSPFSSTLARLAGAASILALSGSPGAWAQVQGVVSVDSNEMQVGVASSQPAMTEGGFIAFTSEAVNLVPGDTNGQSDVFVRDQLAGTTTRVSVVTGGGQATGCSNDFDLFPPVCGSLGPAMSADGRFVAFWSRATDLVTGDTNGHPDVFVHDRLLAVTTRVSLATGGDQATGCSFVTALNVKRCGSFDPAISADGRFVAFLSGSTNLVTGDTNDLVDAFVHDRQSGVTTRVSLATGGLEASGCTPVSGTTAQCGTYAVTISADGRLVGFGSHFTNLVPGDTNAAGDIFVHDRFTATTTRVNIASNGTQANNCRIPSSSQSEACSSGSPAISANGRFVAFVSRAPNLVPFDTAGHEDVFIHDRFTGTTTRVSVGAGGGQANGGSSRPALSADGRFVAFGSEATNLDGACVNGQRHIFVLDRVTGVFTCVTRNVQGTAGNGNSFAFALSQSARFVAFESVATNLSPGDANGAIQDIFLAVGPGPAFFAGGVYVGAGSILGTAAAEIVTGPGAGTPNVRAFNADGSVRITDMFAYDAAFPGGVRVAACDFDGDTRAEIVTGAGPGGGPHVRVIKLDATGAPLVDLASFLAYAPGFSGGVFVGCGDVDGDGVPEVLTGAAGGGGPHVRALKLQGGAPGGVAPLLDFFAFDPAFTGGVRVAAGNIDGSDRAAIVVGAGPGGGPHVRAVKLVGGALVDLANFFAYAPGFTGGVFVAAGDVVGSALAEIVTGADAGGGPHVRVFTGTGADTGIGFFAYAPGFVGGVRVAVGDLDGAGPAEILTAPGPSGGPHIRSFTGTGAPGPTSFFAY
jgi:Tol biopolymer transport system component